jgi:hypothetical protein
METASLEGKLCAEGCITKKTRPNGRHGAVCNKKRKLKGGGERGAHSGGIRGQPQHELCVVGNFRSYSENMYNSLAGTRGSITRQEVTCSFCSGSSPSKNAFTCSADAWQPCESANERHVK